MKSEHHQLVENIADTIMRDYVTYSGPFGYTYRENQIKETLSPLARKIKEQQKEIEGLKAFYNNFAELYGTGLGVADWHANGDLEPFDNFFDEAESEMNELKDGEK